jgi:choline dehydrogenase-like flavoprotein
MYNSFQAFIMTEGVAGPETGFHLSDNGAALRNPPRQNRKTFATLRRHAKSLFRAAGYPVFATGILEKGWHGVGTARMGIDPVTSVVDPACKAHDVDGLYVVDASALVSPGAVNTGLSIAANALRVAAHIAPRGVEHDTPASRDGLRKARLQSDRRAQV